MRRARPATVRRNIEAQGFCGLDDETCARIDDPLRLSPAICVVWPGVGTALVSPRTLWALVPFAAPGAILPGHPFDVLYNFGLRHLLGTLALPRCGVRRRFACALGTIMVIAAALGFQAGMPTVRHLFGWSLVAAAFVNVSMVAAKPGAQSMAMSPAHAITARPSPSGTSHG